MQQSGDPVRKGVQGSSPGACVVITETTRVHLLSEAGEIDLILRSATSSWVLTCTRDSQRVTFVSDPHRVRGIRMANVTPSIVMSQAKTDSQEWFKHVVCEQTTLTET